jgi:predicted RNA-binding Zn-ribbon protein involved in translation (DUF1610 family)
MATLQDMIKKLEKFGEEIQDLSGKQITFLPDRKDMIDRQCPQCNELFMVADKDFDKLKDGTYCPSCGFKANGSDFITAAHRKTAKEAIEKSLHDNWNHRTAIPNNIGELLSVLDLKDQIVCQNCSSTFSTSQAPSHCPVCGNDI